MAGQDYGPKGCCGPTALLMFVTAVGLALALVLGGCSPASGPAQPTQSVAACQEDQPCWDCSTMGNRQCGPERNRGSHPGPPAGRTAR